MRHFNTEGPVAAAEHYLIPPLERVDRQQILTLIQRRKYFVLHAPRQTGKTSTLLALRDLLNSGSEGEYRCVHASLDIGRIARVGRVGKRRGRCFRCSSAWPAPHSGTIRQGNCSRLRYASRIRTTPSRKDDLRRTDVALGAGAGMSRQPTALGTGSVGTCRPVDSP